MLQTIQSKNCKSILGMKVIMNPNLKISIYDSAAVVQKDLSGHNKSSPSLLKETNWPTILSYCNLELKVE